MATVLHRDWYRMVTDDGLYLPDQVKPFYPPTLSLKFTLRLRIMGGP